ncbi:hypothetical protein BDR07DRAFT_30426 [Suillus spraguei]|nr:hypothetical protein BDR07DRAFT_30426 [Suillus spraguei]
MMVNRRISKIPHKFDCVWELKDIRVCRKSFGEVSKRSCYHWRRSLVLQHCPPLLPVDHSREISSLRTPIFSLTKCGRGSRFGTVLLSALPTCHNLKDVGLTRKILQKILNVRVG